MSEPKTLPQTFSIPRAAPPSPAHDAWLIRTEEWLSSFEQHLAANASARAPGTSLGFIVIASDHLWDRQREAADFARLDVPELIEHCRPLLADDDVRRAFTATLCAFYAFLVQRGELPAEIASGIAHELRAQADELTQPNANAPEA